MSTLAISLCFKLDKVRLQDDENWMKLAGIPDLCLKDASTPVVINSGKGSDRMVVVTTQSGSHAVMHVYDDEFLTLDIQHFVPNPESTTPEESVYDYMYIKTLEKSLRNYLGDLCLFSRCLPCPIKRGNVCPYFATGAESLFEYGHLELLHERNSCWQNIKIYKTEQCGNMLCLDDDIMIADSDLIYSQTLLGVDRNNFQNKTVLILGGGDGGLIHELLKEDPKYVLMVEIDEEVISACRTYLRNVCHNSLDRYEGDNYKIMIDDCMKVLKRLVEAGKTYDYVVNDLTEYSLGTDINFSYDYDTACVILETSMKILPPGGKYLSRGNNITAKSFLSRYEDDIRALQLEFSRFDVPVPSFKDTYCLYEVCKPSKKGNKQPS